MKIQSEANGGQSGPIWCDGRNNDAVAAAILQASAAAKEEISEEKWLTKKAQAAENGVSNNGINENIWN